MKDFTHDELVQILEKFKPLVPEETRIALAADDERGCYLIMFSTRDWPPAVIMTYCMAILAVRHAHEVDAGLEFLQEMNTPEPDPKKVM